MTAHEWTGGRRVRRFDRARQVAQSMGVARPSRHSGGGPAGKKESRADARAHVDASEVVHLIARSRPRTPDATAWHALAYRVGGESSRVRAQTSLLAWMILD